MFLLGRSITMLLALALTGGAQACIALCALPAAAIEEHQTTCRHCSPKQSEKSSAPAAPCKHCQVISQERWATQGDQQLTVDFGWTITLIDPAPSIIHGHPAPVKSAERAHAPPGERLHQFCLLLI